MLPKRLLDAGFEFRYPDLEGGAAPDPEPGALTHPVIGGYPHVVAAAAIPSLEP